MRRARVFVHGLAAGILEELDSKRCRFIYDDAYAGAPVSLNMPASQRIYEFDAFPPFFDGLLPEGFQLEALLKQHKIDRRDYFAQLVTVGHDLVGNVTVEEIV
jgi:serine/threonine-protein kinase HipA